MNKILQTASILLILTSAGCKMRMNFTAGTGSNSTLGGTPGGGAGGALTAKDVIKANCAGCHIWANHQTDIEFINDVLVSAGDLANSALYRRLGGRTDASAIPLLQNEHFMPSNLPPLKPDEIALIKSWIQHMSQPGDTSIPPTTSFYTRLGTTHFVETTFRNVFGSNIDTPDELIGDGNSYLTAMVTGPVQFFGGPCDPYRTYSRLYSITVGALIEVTDCGYGFHQASQVSAAPSSNTGREGYSIKMCMQNLKNDAGLTAAVQKVLGAGASVNSLPAPTAVHAKNIVNLFFQRSNIPDNVLTDLLAVGNDAITQYGSTKEAWRYMILTVCMAPEWQMLQ